MSSPPITYAPRPDATPEMELSTLANVYRFVLDCRVKKKAVSAGHTDGDDAKERSLNDSSATKIIPE